ncbi:MAG: hypothetical protein ACI4XJ_02235 [Eubacteriales bacterium]
MKKRYFDSTKADTGSIAVHAVGNGEIMLYGKGPEWMEVLGAPYSCPRIFSLKVHSGDVMRSVTWRSPGTGRWVHELSQGVITDCASASEHCIVRRWELTAPVRFDLNYAFPLQDIRAVFPDNAGAWLITLPSNAAVYNDYPLVHHSCMVVAAQGGCSAEQTDGGLTLTLSDTGTLYVTGSESFPDAMEQMRAALKIPYDRLQQESDAEVNAFLTECAANRPALREHPAREKVLEAVEDTLMVISSQQHREGGVQAGYNYHMGYVRDQYGVSRGLLTMGAWNRAKMIMSFYRSVFARSGYIANAQAMGVDGVFHVHENDLTEITGYLLLQATDLLRVTGDEDFFKTLYPMCDWALKAQIFCLHNDMLPFNGDETYVAGGILPRTILNHGSFEATLLFITGGRRYLDACARLGRAEDWMAEAGRRIKTASERFDENFRRGDFYITNSVKRLDGLTEPAYRHGVCYYGGYFGWLIREAEGCYVCPKCVGKGVPVPDREEYQLKSTMLMAPFVSSDQLPAQFLEKQISQYLGEYRTTGRLPSRPDGNLNVGYDYGLLVYAAAEAGQNADDLLDAMLSLQDECGAWCEYYENGVQRGTQYRPWESAINISGAIRYLAE